MNTTPDLHPLDALAAVQCPHTRHLSMCTPCAADAVRPALERLPLADLYAEGVREARSEVSRTDTKAGLLLTVATAGLAGLVAAATGLRDIPLAASVAMWLTAAIAGAAVLELLTVIRPTVPGRLLTDHQQLLSAAAEDDLVDWQRRRLEFMSALAVRKHRGIRRAVDLLRLDLACLTATTILLLTL